MNSDEFQFKHYKIKQTASVFKVNTEAVLLSAWVHTEGKKDILEIGSGSGVITLGLVQRLNLSNYQLTGIDIDSNAIALSNENISLNPNTQVEFIHSSFQDFALNTKSKYDLIISNPPFYHSTFKSTKESNRLAKYNDQLSLETLLEGSLDLLNEEGTIALVLPFDSLTIIQNLCISVNLCISRLTYIYPNATKPANRILIELSKIETTLIEDKLIIRDGLSYTEAYKNLTKDYYLEF